MGSKKSRKNYDDEMTLFSQATPPRTQSTLDSDEAYEAFRRHMEEHIQAETRAFHLLRSEAESKLQQPTNKGERPPPQAVPKPIEPEQQSLPPRKGKVQSPKTRNPQPLSKPEARPLAAAGPRVRTPWMNGLLCLSFAVLGGLGYQGWQQWHQDKDKPSKISENKARYQARRQPTRESMKIKPLAASVAMAPLPTLPQTSTPAAPAKTQLSVSQPPANAPAPNCAPSEEAHLEPQEKALIVGSGELRRGPSNQYEILDLLPPGTIVEGSVTSDKQWLRLEGGRFLALAQVEILDPKLDARWVDRWVGAKIANVRTLPAMQAAILKKLNQGDAIRISSLNKQWAKIEGGGYIYTALVSEKDSRPLRLPAFMRVAADQATIYTGPGTQFPPVGVYFKNHKVEVMEQRDAWFRVGQDQFIKVQDLEQVAQARREGTRL